MLTSLFETNPDNPRKVVTSRFNNDGIKDYCSQRYNHNSVYRLAAKRNKDGTFDVVAHCQGFRSNFKSTVRYSLSLDDALTELKAFEDEGMAKESVPYEPDRPVYLQRNFIGKRGSNHVYTILEKRSDNVIERAAENTGRKKPASGTAMRLAKLRRNPRG